MKRLSLLIPTLLLFFAFTPVSYGQNVPAKAKDAFNSKFPNAQQVNWGMEGSDVYEAEFKMDGKNMSANFDANGNWKETESAIAEGDLPDAVRQTLSRDYKNVTVHHAFQVDQPNQTVYEVEVGMGENNEKMEEDDENEEHGEKNEKGEMEEGHKNNMHELVFTADGKVVHKKNEEEDEN